MRTRIKLNLIIIMLILMVILNNCGSPASSFFILTPTDGYEQSHVGKSDISIGIGSIELPDYLRRPQILTYSKNNEILFDEYNRWVEPLEENFTRVVVENLSALIPTNNIYLFMWPKEDPNIFQITIKVDQFGLNSDSTVVLDARWSVSGNNKKSLLLTEKSSYREKTESLEYGQITLIMSKLTGDLCKDIASEVKRKAANN